MKKLPLSLHEFAQVAVSLIIAGLAIVNLINYPVRWVNVITLAAGLAFAVIAAVIIIKLRGGVIRFDSLELTSDAELVIVISVINNSAIVLSYRN